MKNWKTSATGFVLGALTVASLGFVQEASAAAPGARASQNAKSGFLAARKKVTLVPQAVSGANVLYYVDYSVGQDSFGLALSSLGISPTYTNDPYSFATLLQQGGWDLVIALQQNSDYSSIFGADLTNWVAGGGKAIYTEWTYWSGLSSVFGAVDTGSTNAGSITLGSSAIWSGLGGTVWLSNPGWGIYSVGLAATGGATVDGTYDSGDGAVVIGNGQRTLINGTLADSYADPNQGIQIAMNEINFLLEGTAPGLRGKIVGQEGKAQVTCTNTTTGQSVLKKSKGKYDCVKSGLTVHSGDGFSISITGTVD